MGARSVTHPNIFVAPPYERTRGSTLPGPPNQQHGNRVVIRRAAPEDATSISAVLSDAFAEYRSRYTKRAFEATTPQRDQIRERFDEGPIWVALDEGMVVGTVSAVPRGKDLYVRSMAVTPRKLGKGVGHALLERAEEFAAKNGFERLLLSTTPFLLRAIELYSHSGFIRSGEGPHELFGTPLFTMTKSLKRRWRNSAKSHKSRCDI